MKTYLSISIKIALLVFLVTGILACNHVINQKDLSYSIPYIKSDPADLKISKLSDKKDLIPLFADQFGNIPARNDLSAEFKAGWNSDGLFMYCQVNDNLLHTDTINPWKSDAIEIFIASYRGSTDIIQLTIVPHNNPDFTKAFINVKSYRTSDSIKNLKVSAIASSKRNGTETFFKVLIPLESLGIIPTLNTRLAMQVYVNDSDSKDEPLKNQLQWYPVGHSYDNSYAMYSLLLTKRGEAFPKETSKCYIKDNDSVIISIYSNTFKNRDVLISKNNHHLFSSITSGTYPVNFSLPMDKINPDRDTIRVFLNNKLISEHDLFYVPRIYERLETPGVFEREIRFFEAQDRKSYPPENAILFIGSSSIKRWYNIKDYFPDNAIIHRGFGGSTAADALFYIQRIVLNYKPAKIVYYEGDNDIAKGFSTEKIISAIDSFINIVHINLPGTEIFIIPPKPSFARYRLWNKYLDLNATLKLLTEKYSFVSYIDIVKPMFDDNGALIKDIFEKDNLHLNEKGYKIWGQTIRKEMGF